MKKLCIILGSLSKVGGTGRAVSILANHLCKEYDVRILCYSQNLDRLGYSLDPSIQVDSIFNKKIRMTYGIFKMIPYMMNYFRKYHIETVLICGVLNFIGGIIAGKTMGVKVVCCDHSNYTCIFDAKFERESRNFAARFSDYLVTLTEKDIINYQHGTNVKAKIVAIPNIIDDKLISVNEHVIYNQKSKKIISVGRLTYAKNYDLLIEIASVILKKNPQWSWDIFGDGELRKELEEKIQSMGIERLTLKGNVNNIYELYSQYSFLVMTSRYEGFPMVLLEAMSNKLPCIAFDCQTGPSDIIIDHINGELIEEANKNVMIETIQRLIEDSNNRQYLSGNTRLTLEKFATPNTIKKWKSII